MSHKTIQQNTNRLLALLLAVMLVFTYAPTAYAEGEGGSCGENLSWSLSAGTLTISGSGAMTDFPESTMAPWYGLREEILRLELPGGLTSIGSLAFYGCKNLTAVTIPDSVERIGSYAFAHCSGMQMLDLGSVRSVGEAAFSDCVSLTALSLPGTLTTIGTKAFYRCESIPSVIVPASVTSIGMSAFGYCKSLVSADVQASIQTIPEFLFYGCSRLSSVSLPDTTSNISDFAFRGCTQLSSVHYGGTDQSLSQIQSTITNDVPGFENGGSVTNTPASGYVSTSTSQDNGDGTVTQESVIVVQGTNASVSAKVENTDADYGADFSVTVEGDDGWEDAQFFIEATLNNTQNQANESGGKVAGVNVDVYVKGTDKINSDFVDSMADRNVKLTITTQNGSVWRVDGTKLDKASMSGDYNLSYILTAGTAELCTELGTQTSFVLQFQESAEVNSEVLIRLGTSYVQQEATLLQRLDGELIQVQTGVVDTEGYAHFYLASVNKKTEYYIAMNLPAAAEEAIVPEEMLSSYGAAVQYTPIEYEITGRTSSWGMNIKQVTWIMVGVLAAVVLIVGFTMYALNKRKLKMGYIPELDEEDYM